ncbi:MAG: hypothetical protein ACYTFY_16380, partial [Planctomycetota bacterium]
LEFWADNRICHSYLPGEHDDTFHTSYILDNNDKRVLDRDGSTCRTLSLAYPEYRKFKIDFYLEQVERGIDGIYINLQRFLPLVGFEEATVNSFIDKHGFAPGDSKNDWKDLWIKHTCDIVTQFFRELKSALQKKTDKKIPVAIQFHYGWNIGRNNFNSLIDAIDPFTLAREGLVDVFAPTGDDCLWSADMVLDHINMLKDVSNCEIWPCLGQSHRDMYSPEGEKRSLSGKEQGGDTEVILKGTLDPWRVMRNASDMYNQGADGIFLWECHEIAPILPYWNVIKNIGNRELLRTTFGRPLSTGDGRDSIERLKID